VVNPLSSLFFAESCGGLGFLARNAPLSMPILRPIPTRCGFLPNLYRCNGHSPDSHLRTRDGLPAQERQYLLIDFKGLKTLSSSWQLIRYPFSLILFFLVR
jgi:hypothetical protein